MSFGCVLEFKCPRIQWRWAGASQRVMQRNLLPLLTALLMAALLSVPAFARRISRVSGLRYTSLLGTRKMKILEHKGEL